MEACDTKKLLQWKAFTNPDISVAQTTKMEGNVSAESKFPEFADILLTCFCFRKEKSYKVPSVGL